MTTEADRYDPYLNEYSIALEQYWERVLLFTVLLGMLLVQVALVGQVFSETTIRKLASIVTVGGHEISVFRLWGWMLSVWVAAPFIGATWRCVKRYYGLGVGR